MNMEVDRLNIEAYVQFDEGQPSHRLCPNQNSTTTPESELFYQEVSLRKPRELDKMRHYLMKIGTLCSYQRKHNTTWVLLIGSYIFDIDDLFSCYIFTMHGHWWDGATKWRLSASPILTFQISHQIPIKFTFDCVSAFIGMCDPIQESLYVFFLAHSVLIQFQELCMVDTFQK